MNFSCLDFAWLPAALVILFSGLVGGLAAYHLDKLGDTTKAHPSLLRIRGYLSVGIAAAFTIPLFLHTASSHLLEDAPNKPFLYFVLAGFCIVAAVFSRRFLKAVGYQALQIAERTAERTEQVAETAKKEMTRTRHVISSIGKIDRGLIKEAISDLEKIVRDDPQNSEALSWIAYAYKRDQPPQIQAAVTALERALELENEKPFNWLYNLACYKALIGASENEIVSLLRKAANSATQKELALLKNDLQSDEDFASLKGRADSSFEEFIRKL